MGNIRIAQRKIPENLLIPILTMWKDGKQSKEIAEWLFNEHGIDVQPVTVTRRLLDYKKAAQQATLDAIRESAGAGALDYISMQDQDIMKLNRMANKLLDSAEIEDQKLGRMLIETKGKIIDRQMRLTGVDKQTEEIPEEEELIDGLLKKLGKSNEKDN